MSSTKLYNLTAGLFALCRCGHWQISHAHDSKRRRTFCTHADATGLCACERYEPQGRLVWRG